MKRLVRIAFLLAGLSLLAVFVARADWPAVGAGFARLGWLAPLALLPYLVVYLVDTHAWAVTLVAPRVPAFGRLFRIRWAGESVNNLVPTGYVGGEAVKVFLLRQHGVSTSDGAAAALVSKTAQSIAQALFVILGAVLLATLAPPTGGLRTALWGIAAAGVTGVGTLVLLQRRGLGATLAGALNRLGVQSRRLERHRPQIDHFDRLVREFQGAHRGRLLLSVALFLAGWLLDAVEVFVVGRLMGVPISVAQALAVEAFIGVAKVVGLFVPGAVGVQESGVVLVCRLAGLPPSFGEAYAVWRRGRELLYALVGLLLLGAAHTSLKQIRREIPGVAD